ncbi:unnamed protein product, partial [Brassica rapa subsp. narinosa]
YKSTLHIPLSPSIIKYLHIKKINNRRSLLYNTLSARGSDQLKFINPKVLKPAELSCRI